VGIECCQRPSIYPLSRYVADSQKTKEAYWQKFVQDWFVSHAMLRVFLGEGAETKDFGN
jgi:hypothetical protein